MLSTLTKAPEMSVSNNPTFLPVWKAQSDEDETSDYQWRRYVMWAKADRFFQSAKRQRRKLRKADLARRMLEATKRQDDKERQEAATEIRTSSPKFLIRKRLSDRRSDELGDETNGFACDVLSPCRLSLREHLCLQFDPSFDRF